MNACTPDAARSSRRARVPRRWYLRELSSGSRGGIVELMHSSRRSASPWTRREGRPKCRSHSSGQPCIVVEPPRNGVASREHRARTRLGLRISSKSGRTQESGCSVTRMRPTCRIVTIPRGDEREGTEARKSITREGCQCLRMPSNSIVGFRPKLQLQDQAVTRLVFVVNDMSVSCRSGLPIARRPVNAGRRARRSATGRILASAIEQSGLGHDLPLERRRAARIHGSIPIPPPGIDVPAAGAVVVQPARSSRALR